MPSTKVIVKIFPNRLKWGGIGQWASFRKWSIDEQRHVPEN